MSLTTEQIERYSRHLPLFGSAGQKRLLNAKILCVGAGGLGAPILQYLTAAGVGTLGIVDGDKVELSNLQRQVIFNEADIGKYKALQAAAYLKKMNHDLNIVICNEFIGAENAESIVKDFDIIIDGTDNYYTRYLLNDVSVKLKKPLVAASIYQYQGQCSVFNYQDGPCYRCLFEIPPPEDEMPNCAQGGVLGVLPGLLGCIQAAEVLKIILQQGQALSHRLLILDVLTMTTREFRIEKNPACLCCQQEPSADHLFTEKKYSVPTIDAITLSKAIAENEQNIFLLDVREPYEREICHINGAHIPLAQLASRLNELPKDKKIICYCKGGMRSQRAGKLLMTNGFEKVFSLQGGILDWIKYVDSTLLRY